MTTFATPLTSEGLALFADAADQMALAAMAFRRGDYVENCGAVGRVIDVARAKHDGSVIGPVLRDDAVYAVDPKCSDWVADAGKCRKLDGRHGRPLSERELDGLQAKLWEEWEE